jgi:paraquat-inducible protein B
MNAKRARPALVGMFVLIAGGLVLGAIALWGSGRLLGREYHYVCLFPGSINGLTVGSPVKYRGVPIGVVRDMRIPYSTSTDVRVAVVIELQSQKLRARGGESEPTPDVVRWLVERGLYAQLRSESIITGQLYVALDIHPGQPMVRHAEESPTHMLEIPTLPSETEELQQMLSAAAAELGRADLPRVAISATAAFEAITRLAGDVQLQRALTGASDATVAWARLADDLDRAIVPLTSTLNAAAQGTKSGANRLGDLLGELRATLAPDSPLFVEAERTLQQVQRAAGAARGLFELLERTPNALVVGKRP